MGTQVGIVGVAVAVVSLVFAALQTRAAHRQAHAAEDQVKRMRLEHEDAAVAQEATMVNTFCLNARAVVDSMEAEVLGLVWPKMRWALSSRRLSESFRVLREFRQALTQVTTSVTDRSVEAALAEFQQTYDALAQSLHVLFSATSNLRLTRGPAARAELQQRIQDLKAEIIKLERVAYRAYRRSPGQP